MYHLKNTPKLSEYYWGHLLSHHFFSLNPISSSLRRSFHIKIPLGVPGHQGHSPGSLHMGRDWHGPLLHTGSQEMPKAFNNLKNLAHCIPLLLHTSLHVLPLCKIKLITIRCLVQLSYEPQKSPMVFPVLLWVSKMIIIEVVTCLWHSLEAASFASLLLKWYHQFLTLTSATSLLSYCSFLHLASEPMHLSENALTERVSWLWKKIKNLFSVFLHK